jgi:hypothetical protein
MKRCIRGVVVALALAGSAFSQTATMGAQTSTISGSSRGYWFTAPADFTMTGVQVLTQTGSTNAFQNFAVVRFTGAVPPPNFSSVTNAFTPLALGFDLPQNAFQPVSIAIAAGDVIGVYGNTAASSGTTTGAGSYAGVVQQTTTILGNTVNLYRSGMQFHLGSATSPQGMHDVWSEPSSFNITRVEFTYTPAVPTVPTAYCTVGTTTNGCSPTISAANNPNLAQSNVCSITVSNVEGQRTGILFYGVHGTVSVPWCTAGGSSFLCVKTPLWRTLVQSTGGTFGACDGTLVLDWNAYQIANPSADGNPWAAGLKAHVQGWFHDPPACRTTFLSEALELTYVP